ncbi:MAG: HAMP domain-containing sensor histidine kinase [Sulfuricurvum sp.]|uniref:sensor histidine kinase n=1 Tax=Sulfuricurvum sp. TaxID=2025608 RepID=UPI0027329685|nr:HAMP domain-containing sensor histidine kinase [Sulfuricurvum sp.]MDP2851531.1 HAMP domain-containing sensor histidine kinase [Sulfuricurvum sp.]
MKDYSEQQTLAYVCMNAIGNSLVLENMLSDVITTFVHHTGALGGNYLTSVPTRKKIVTVEKDFDTPVTLCTAIEEYSIVAVASLGYILDIPIGNEHFLFAFENSDGTDGYGRMFAGFKTKLTNAIDACRSTERLHELNTALENQVVEAKNKHEITEKMMITQSRMAIMGEMIGMIAHQWRQPITVIGMITNNTILTLEFDEINKQHLLDDLNVIDKQIHYLSTTIDDFRNFFRPNKLPQSVSLREMSNDLLTMLGKNYKNFGINLTFTGDVDAAFVTYKNELMQVFLNILTNSKDAFEERLIPEPFIQFNSVYNEENIVFSIRDNAGGISEEIIDKVFDPYFSTKVEKNGTGLGLYMSAIIIEKHLNGSIQVCNDAEGSVFTLSIPTNYTKDITYVF